MFFFVAQPGAVGDFDGGALAVPASTSGGGAVAGPGATQTGAHAIHAVVVVARLPGRPGPEAAIGGLVPQLENRRGNTSRGHFNQFPGLYGSRGYKKK